MTGAEVDALRLSLKKKLSALVDLSAHIVTFRGHLARLTTAGQAPLGLNAYRLFLASLSPFPVFHQYILLWTVANGAIGQQTFEAYAVYILGQHSNILAHSNIRPFAGNIEGYEDGASEDDGMGGDSHTLPNFPPTIIPPIPYCQCHATLLRSSPTLPSSTIFTTPPWPWSQPLPLPHGQWFLPSPFPRCCPCPCLLTLRQERQQTERQ